MRMICVLSTRLAENLSTSGDYRKAYASLIQPLHLYRNEGWINLLGPALRLALR